MTQEEFKNLSTGDIVRHKGAHREPFVVHANYGGRVTAARTADLTNPAEWEIILKANLEKSIAQEYPSTPNEVGG